ncbi:MAG TPA: GNAT family N-acetyltransferase [Thermodesulfovibrionales bacterium]|nr:GNAT family N-acetyltransferase [Thermodesulfovibrionales bacterium]
MIPSLKTKLSVTFAKKRQEENGYILFPYSGFLFKIPRYMDDGRVRLRPLRISDIAIIHDDLQNGDILKTIGLTRPLTGSWIYFWWWVRKTLMFRYAIEADSRLVGLMGLYHVLPGNSTELTLVVAEEKSRRLGYGSRAFILITQALKKYSSVEQLIVKVKQDNNAACSFWSKLGFKHLHDENSFHVMSFMVKSLHNEL